MNDQSAPQLDDRPAPAPGPRGWRRGLVLVAIAGAAIWGALEVRDRAHPASGAIRGLRSGQVEERRAAARGLAGLDLEDSKLAIPALAAAAGDADEGVALAVLGSLGEAGIATAQDPASRGITRDAIAGVAGGLGDRREPVRAEAARILGQFAGLPVRAEGPVYNPDALANALAPIALGDPGLVARAEAARTLLAVAGRSPTGPPRTLANVLVAPDRPGDERGTAAALLGAFAEGRPASLPMLARALGDADPRVRRGAAVGLSMYGRGAAQAALPALLRVLAEPLGDPATYRGTGLAITGASPNANRYPPGVVDVNAAGAGSPPPAGPAVTWDPAVIAAAAIVPIARGEDGEATAAAVAALAEALAGPHRWRREAAAYALAEVGAPAAPATPALIAALRAALADATPEPTAKLVPYLIQALGKAAPRTDGAAAAVEAIAAAIPSPIRGATYWATATLGEFGAAAAGTLPALREAAKDPDAFVAANSADSIHAIEHPDEPRRRAPAEGPPGG